MSHWLPGLFVDAGDGPTDRGVDPGGHAEDAPARLAAPISRLA